MSLKTSILYYGALVIGTIITACVSVPVEKSSRNPAQISGNSGVCQGLSPLSNGEFTWPIVRDRISSQSSIFNSVDKALCLVPREYATQNVAMMLNSFSLQRSSLSDPRAIVFPSESSDLSSEMLFMSHNSAGFPGGSALEFVRYNPKAPVRNQIEMAEIEFTDKVSIHQGTPIRCQKCHGIEPQFLWSERDFWPAAAAGESIYRTHEEFAQLKKSLQSNERLKSLNIGEFGSMRSRLSGMNYLATLINSRRLYQKILESPDYSYYKFAILAGAFGCTNIEGFLPNAIRARHQNISFVTENSPSRVAQYLNKVFTREAQTRFKSVNRPTNQLIANHLNDLVGSFLTTYGLRNWPSLFGVKAEELKNRPVFTRSAFPYYLAEQIQIEQDKLLFGMKPDDFFALDPVFDLASVNLRYLFEGRGIGIDNWSYNDITAVYHIDLETMTLHPGGLTNVMIRSDRELSFEETSTLPLLDPDDRGRIFRFSGSQESLKICSSLQTRSLTRLDGLKQPTVFDLRSNAVLAAANWQHHFTDIGKVPNLPTDLPTNPKSTRSCTQCHFGYVANYTGPEFIRQSKNHPLALMICANCHSDKVNKMAPFIPFNDEATLRKFAANDPSFVIGVEHRLDDDAKGQLLHMPPVFRLKRTERDVILKYIRSL